jgi:hypothetical protein
MAGGDQLSPNPLLCSYGVAGSIHQWPVTSVGLFVYRLSGRDHGSLAAGQLFLP